MKKILILLVSALLISSGCAPNVPQERPRVENQVLDETKKGNEALEEDKSAIFNVGDIEYLKVRTDAADIKSGLGNSFNTVGTLKKGDIIKAQGQLNDWYVVLMDNNQVGALDSTQAEPFIKQDTTVPTQPQPTQQGGGQQANQPSNVPTRPQEGPEPNAAPLANNQGQTNQATTKLEGLSSEEQRMVDLINQERTKNSLPALKVDLEVARVAEIKAQDMVDSNYFAHNSPNYGSPFDMLRSFGVKFLAAGENLAGTKDVDRAHTNLMNSSGHRKNILHPSFTHVGIGVKPSPRYGKVYVQMFIKK